MDQLSIPRPFGHQPMLARDPTRTGQKEEGLSRASVIRFGRFSVLPRARQLLVDGRPVELGSRAFDLLMVLIRAPGVLLTKNEIISRVWPDVVVEQNNLKVQVAALRKVLNQDRDGAPQPVLHSADLEHDLVQRHRQLDWLRSKSSASRGGLGR